MTDSIAAERGLHVLHVDMDCFFAAVEVREDPTLVGRAVIVGGTGGRGVVAAASYEARVYGVHSAMPTGEARQLCPNAVYLTPRHGLYSQVSEQMMTILRDVTPIVEPLSLDEAFLDVSGAHGLFGSSEQIAQDLRARIFEELGLYCSIGVGTSKLIAKLASKAAKPVIDTAAKRVREGRGVVVVRADEELAFLHAHPVRALPGVGPRTAARLRQLGISGVGELASLGRARLVQFFGKSHGAGLDDLANGRDQREVEHDRSLRSIGHEQTFARDDHDRRSLDSKAKGFAVQISAKLRESGRSARTISLKVRFGDFRTITRSRTLARGVMSATTIGEIACALLAEVEDLEVGVRLLGVAVSSFDTTPETDAAQLSLFADDKEPEMLDKTLRREELESAADQIRRRYGTDALRSLAASKAQTPRGQGR